MQLWFAVLRGIFGHNMDVSEKMDRRPKFAIFMGLVMKHDEAMKELGHTISRQSEDVVTNVHQIHFGLCGDDGLVLSNLSPKHGHLVICNMDTPYSPASQAFHGFVFHSHHSCNTGPQNFISNGELLGCCRGIRFPFSTNHKATLVLNFGGLVMVVRGMVGHSATFLFGGCLSCPDCALRSSHSHPINQPITPGASLNSTAGIWDHAEVMSPARSNLQTAPTIPLPSHDGASLAPYSTGTLAAVLFGDRQGAYGKQMGLYRAFD